jgi:uncharacterized protein (DUF983 family)
MPGYIEAAPAWAYITAMSLAQVLGGMKRGALARCPHCNDAPLFYRYLKVQQTCTACGHDNGQYPADDGPAYFTILIIGHLFIAPLLFLPFVLEWPPQWVALTIIPPLLVLTLVLLPRIKGAVIGLQWGLREVEGRVPGQDETGSF